MQTTAYADREVLVGSLKLHYQEWGDPSAPPVILLHGFGLSGHMFDEFARAVGDRYHLLCLDQRGHGDSDWSPEGDYSRDAFVADLEGFREALELERFLLVGHSMGGLNAVAYAVRHPDRVERLVLVDVGPEAAKEGVDNIVRFTRGPDNLEFEEFVELAHRFNPRRTRENIRERMRYRLRPADVEGKWTWKFDSRFRTPDSGIVVGSKMNSEETWALFRQVSVPTLLVRGGESDVLAAEVAEKVVQEMRDAHLVVVPGAGHSVPGDAPEAFTEAVVSFFAGEFDRTPEAEDEVPEPVPEEEQEEGDAAEERTRAASQEALRAEYAASEGAFAGLPDVRRAGSTTGLVIAVGAAAVTATALVLGARALSRRRTRRRRTRSPAATGGGEAAAIRSSAEAVFEELTAVGRQRLQSAHQEPDEAVAKATSPPTSSPGPKTRRRRSGRGSGGGRALVRFMGRGAAKGGWVVLREAWSILGPWRRKR